VRQRLGQHFLRDSSVVSAILAAAELQPYETALEIGPGKGVLTGPLSSRVERLVAVELDDALAGKLRSTLNPSRVDIIHADFLKVDLDSLFPVSSHPIKVLGNLPYSITAPIFEKLLAWPGWQTGVFLIQKEVAERMQSAPGSKSFGILTLAVQLYAKVEKIMLVKPGAFSPPPEVTSAVIRLHRHAALLIAPEHVAAYFDLAHAAFAHRRKTLANSLAMFTKNPRKEIEIWLLRQGISPGVRAEMLSAQEYVRLAEPWSIYRRRT
jgi:16S rRNA (adenine1518-N6/adenine1519-N6)-dimethyltransferase